MPWKPLGDVNVQAYLSRSESKTQNFAIDFSKLVNRNLVRIIKDTSEIDENRDLKKKGGIRFKINLRGPLRSSIRTWVKKCGRS